MAGRQMRRAPCPGPSRATTPCTPCLFASIDSIGKIVLSNERFLRSFWGRLHNDLNQSVILTDESILAEAAYSLSIDRRLRGGNKARGFVPTYLPNISAPPDVDIPDMSFNNEAFKQALAAFATSVPSDVKDFYGGWSSDLKCKSTTCCSTFVPSRS